MSEKFYPVSIAFACRDGNGNFNETCRAIHIGEEILDLENKYWNPTSPKLGFKIDKILQDGGFAPSKVKGSVKISRRKFPIVGYKSYWGNLVWDCVVVSHETAMEFIEYLRTLKTFRVECGAINWWDKFESDKPFEFTDEEISDLKKYGYQRP